MTGPAGPATQPCRAVSEAYVTDNLGTRVWGWNSESMGDHDSEIMGCRDGALEAGVSPIPSIYALHDLKRCRITTAANRGHCLAARSPAMPRRHLDTIARLYNQVRQAAEPNYSL